MFRTYHGERLKCLGMLENFEVAEPTETAPRQFTGVGCGHVLNVEQ